MEDVKRIIIGIALLFALLSVIIGGMILFGKIRPLEIFYGEEKVTKSSSFYLEGEIFELFTNREDIDIKIRTRYDVNVTIDGAPMIVAAGTDVTTAFSPMIEDKRIVLSIAQLGRVIECAYPDSTISIDYAENIFSEDLFECCICVPIADDLSFTFMSVIPNITGVEIGKEEIVL